MLGRFLLLTVVIGVVAMTFLSWGLGILLRRRGGHQRRRR